MIEVKQTKITAPRFKDGVYLFVEYMVGDADGEKTEKFRIIKETEQPILEFISLIKQIWDMDWNAQIDFLDTVKNDYLDTGEFNENHPMKMYARQFLNGVEYDVELYNDGELILPSILTNHN